MRGNAERYKTEILSALQLQKHTPTADDLTMEWFKKGC